MEMDGVREWEAQFKGKNSKCFHVKTERNQFAIQALIASTSWHAKNIIVSVANVGLANNNNQCKILDIISLINTLCIFEEMSFIRKCVIFVRDAHDDCQSYL